MAEATTKLRLVRCPKCENLLPELEDYSVYQCGGCGAILRATNKHREADPVSEKSEEERGKGALTASRNSSEKEGAVNSSETSDSDVISNAESLKHKENGVTKCGDGYSEKCKDKPQARTETWVVKNDPSMNMSGEKSGDRNPVGSVQVDSISQSGLQGSARILDWRSGERNEADGFRKRTMLRNDLEGVRLSTSNHPDEGTSNYFSDSSYGYRKPLRIHDEQNGGNVAQYMDRDRAELLRKLDELKEQLSRSCNVVDKSKEKVPVGQNHHPDKPPMPFYGNGKHVAGPPYYHHYPEPFPYINGHEMPTHGKVYPSAHGSNHMPGYGDPFGFPMHRRALQQLPSHPYYSGQYVDTNQDLFQPYPQNGIFHQPSCSCFHCYDKHRPTSAPALPPQRFGDVPYNPGLYPHENISPFGPPHNYNPRTFVPPPSSSSCAPQTHARWPSELGGPDISGFSRGRPPKVVLASSARHTRPVAGGAPFLTCQNCFELLQLPKKAQHLSKKQQKLQCGACSSVINLAVVDKKLLLSLNPETKPVSTEVDSHVHRMAANFSSDDYDSPNYEFHSLDREAFGDVNSSKPLEMHNLHSLSPSASEEENSSDSSNAHRVNASPPPPGSPLQENFDYSSTNHAVHHRFGIGNRSARSENEKAMIPNKLAARQNSLKEECVATEMEVSFNEYSNNTGVSQDSVDGTREDDQPKSKRGVDAFFVNFVKKSFKDLTKSSQNEEHGKSNVTVNGHPISERLAKKAEKLAGPIQPGNYWYDYRGGFWGVMGGPCLGIVPPYIEELNYPMPENCAGGNTSVFVNGRELHRKDLELLAARGLPTDRGRSYIVDISGKVLDEDSGKELDSLGKLAPTIEKVKRGFGMKVPRVAAQ